MLSTFGFNGAPIAKPASMCRMIDSSSIVSKMPELLYWLAQHVACIFLLSPRWIKIMRNKDVPPPRNFAHLFPCIAYSALLISFVKRTRILAFSLDPRLFLIQKWNCKLMHVASVSLFAQSVNRAFALSFPSQRSQAMLDVRRKREVGVYPFEVPRTPWRRFVFQRQVNCLHTVGEVNDHRRPAISLVVIDTGDAGRRLSTRTRLLYIGDW